MRNPIAAALVLGTWVVIVAPGASDAAPERAYKPAQRREDERAEQAARKAPPAAAQDTNTPANITDPEAYQKDLDAAKEQRDRDLKEAANETDRKKFAKRKEEIFARYASILAAMREKYEAHEAETGDPAQAPPQRPGKVARPGAVKPGSSDRSGTAERPGRPEPRKKAVRRDDDDATADADATPRGNAKVKRPVRSRGDDATGTLADAQNRLDDENARHDTAMSQLNQDLKDAQAAKKQRDIRKAERAIEKENTTYEAKKVLLESRVKELGGKIGTPAPAVR